jgi:hypothetical protein
MIICSYKLNNSSYVKFQIQIPVLYYIIDALQHQLSFLAEVEHLSRLLGVQVINHEVGDASEVLE